MIKEGRLSLEKSLSARKKALQEQNNNVNNGNSNISNSKLETIIEKQLEIIEKQSKQIDELIKISKNPVIVTDSGSIKNKNKSATVDEYDEPLFLDDFVKTDGIEATGRLKGKKSVGRSIDDKLKKFKDLNKK